MRPSSQGRHRVLAGWCWHGGIDSRRSESSRRPCEARGPGVDAAVGNRQLEPHPRTPRLVWQKTPRPRSPKASHRSGQEQMSELHQSHPQKHRSHGHQHPSQKKDLPCPPRPPCLLPRWTFIHASDWPSQVTWPHLSCKGVWKEQFWDLTWGRRALGTEGPAH